MESRFPFDTGPAVLSRSGHDLPGSSDSPDPTSTAVETIATVTEESRLKCKVPWHTAVILAAWEAKV